MFRNGNPSTVKTKFFGVAGGRVQFEDCLFDGVESPEVNFDDNDDDYDCYDDDGNW